MRELERLTWNGFGGINRRGDPYDINDVQGVEVKNLKLSRSVGKLVKCPGYTTAQLNSVDFAVTGLGGRTINALGVLHTAHADASSPYYICQAGTDNKFYRWNAGTWVELTGFSTTVDANVVKFIRRENALLAPVGSGSGNYPILFAFCPARFRYAFATSGAASALAPVSAGLQSDTAQLKKYDDLTGVTMTIREITHAEYTAYGFGIGYYPGLHIKYKVAVQYDGFQWSAPSDYTWEVYTAAGYAQVSITFDITASTYNKRITGFRIYRNANYGDETGQYHLMREIGVNDKPTRDGGSEKAGLTNIRIGASGSYYNNVTKAGLTITFTQPTEHTTAEFKHEYQLLGISAASFAAESVDYEDFTYLLPVNKAAHLVGTDVIYILNEGGLADGAYYVTSFVGWLKYDAHYYYNFIDNGFDATVYTGAHDLIDEPEMYAHLGYVPDESASLNYELAHVAGKRQAVARIWDGEKTDKSVVRVSNISNIGTYDYDVFHADEVISLQEYGVTEVIGIHSWRNDFLIFTKEDIIIVSPVSGASFAWSLYDTIQRVGLAASRSIVKANSDIYYLNNNGPYRFREASSELLSDVVDPDDWPLGVTDITECVAELDNTRDEVLFAFPSNNMLLAYDLLSQQWTEYELPISPRILLRDNDDTLMISDGTDLVALSFDSTDFDGTAITPEYRSKEIKFSETLILLYAFEIRANSDSEFQVKLYLDGALYDTRTIPSGDLETYQKLDAAKLCNRVQFAVTMSSVQSAANTQFEVRSFTLLYKKVGRV